MRTKKTHLKKRIIFFLAIFGAVTVAGLVSGCSKKTSKNTGYAIYCLDTNETKITSEAYTPKKKSGKELVQELLKQLQKEPEDISYKKAIPDNVELDTLTLSDDGDLCLYWTASYGNYTGTSEILRRAAIVKTLCQIPNVENVQFYVAGQPLTDSNMEPIGYMTADTFVDNTGDIPYEQTAKLKLYFANEDGTALQGITVDVTYDATVSLEQLAVQQLINGPDGISEAEEQNLKKTIPNGTKLNTVSVKENTCYLDLSSEFLEKRADISDNVAIYSVVNTLTELSSINRVQFFIDGEQVLLYDDVVDFGEPFEANLDLMER